MNQIILLRHGEADHTERGLTGGWTDSHLTPLGREQAQITGEWLAGPLEDVPFRLYSSDLRRAGQTAEIIGECVGIEPVYDQDLREFNNGQAANMTVEQAQRIQLPMNRPLAEYVPYPGAENWAAMNERVCVALDVIAEHGPDVVVVIAHTLSGTCIVHWWLGLGQEHWGRVSYDFEPCSITLLTMNVFGQRTISRLNDTRHLAAADCESDVEALPGVQAQP